MSVGGPVGQAEGNSGIRAQVQPSLLQHQRQHLHLHIASPFSSGYYYCPKRRLLLLQARAGRVLQSRDLHLHMGAAQHAVDSCPSSITPMCLLEQD